MLTPRFELSQTEDCIIITIYAPYGNVAETEIFVAEEHFRFYSTPYYLRLHLPGEVEETDASSAKYEADTGRFVISIDKVTKGEHFPDLDLLTTLLAPRKAKSDVGKAAIEVLDDIASKFKVDDDLDQDSEWFIEQSVDEPEITLAPSVAKYGFANQSSGVFTNFKYEFNEIVDVKDPDSLSSLDRLRLQAETEAEDFCESHYWLDFMDTECIQLLLDYVPTFRNKDIPVQLGPSELDVMKELPNREYLLSKGERQVVYYGLVDILFAYCYNHRTNLGDNNTESAWNINKLSATLSWLQSFRCVDDAVKSAVRRSLIYTLYRNYDLAVKVVEDVAIVLQAGKKQALKCLLEIHSLFNLSEPRYLLNQLYIQDYCVWIQQCSATRLTQLAAALAKCVPSKADLDLDLVVLEKAAMLAKQDEDDNDVAASLGNLQLEDTQIRSSTQDLEATHESDTSSDSDSSSDSSSSSDCDSSSPLDSDDLSDPE